MINLPIKALHATWESSRGWRELAPLMGSLLPWLGESEAPEGHRGLGGVDFSSLERLRGYHLLPLIFQEVARRGLEKELPKAVLNELREAYLMAFQEAARQEAEIPQVVRALSRAGVEALILKGADLRHRLYADLVVRPMEDLDVLISRPGLRTAEKILVQLGYLPLPEPRPGFAERFENEIAFRPGPGKYLKVDLHFDELRALGPIYRLPFPRLAAKAQPLDLAGLAAKVLAPEHALIHLCVHNFSDFTVYRPFAMSLTDLFLALSRLPLDWDFFSEETSRFRCQAPVYLMLRSMASLPGVPVPTRVLDGLGEYRPSWRERLVQRMGYLGIHLSVLGRHRRFSDWAFFFRAKLWPQPSYTRENFGSVEARLRTLFQKFSPS